LRRVAVAAFYSILWVVVTKIYWLDLVYFVRHPWVASDMSNLKKIYF